MRVFPGAVVRPISRNYSTRRRATTRGVIFHVAASEAASLYGWFNNPAAKASSHLYVRRDGTCEQYVDMDLTSWTSGKASATTIGIETQGYGGPWTPEQCETLARIAAWAHHTYGVPLQLMASSRASERGIGWHAQGVPASRKQLAAGVSQTGGELWSKSPGKVCLPVDITEVLTARGWINLGEVRDDDLVASVDPTGATTFDAATRIEPFESDTITVGRWECTPDHQWVVRRAGPSRCLECDFSGKRRAVGVHRQHTGHEVERSDVWEKIPAAEVSRAYRLLRPAPRTEGLPFTLDQIRMSVWLFADGHYIRENGSHPYGVEWHFTKVRKTNRVCELLDALGVDYRRGQRKDGTEAIRVWGEQGRKLVSILPTKRYTPEWAGVSREQIEAMWEELRQADGASTVEDRVCFSTDRDSLDVLQAASEVNGLASTMWYSSNLWWLRLRQTRLHLHTAIPARRTTVSCLTTKNGTLIIRQNGRPVVTGNCPGPERVAQIPSIVARARILAGLDTQPTTDRALADAGVQIGDPMKTVGIYYEDGDTTVYGILNPVSGFFNEYSRGAGAGPMGGVYNNPLAHAFDANSFAYVTKSHFEAIKASCAAVRANAA